MTGKPLMNRQGTQDARLILMAAAAVVVLWLLYLARWGLLFVYVSVLIATGVQPLIDQIEGRTLPGTRRGLSRRMAALTVYLGGIAVAVAVGSAVVPALIAQARELGQNLPELVEESQSFLIRHGVLPNRLELDEIVKQLPNVSTTLGSVISGFGSVLGAVFAAVLILVLSFYLVNESGSLFDAAMKFVPTQRRPAVRKAVAEITEKIGSWMVGQLMLCLIVGAITAAVLGILGIPYFYVLALLAAVGELIPYAGPVVAAIPALGLATTISWQMVLMVGGFYVLLQQLENHLLVPKLMQHQVGLSPASVIIAITIGSMVLGILGAILAVPTAAILQVALAAVRPER